MEGNSGPLCGHRIQVAVTLYLYRPIQSETSDYLDNLAELVRGDARNMTQNKMRKMVCGIRNETLRRTIALPIRLWNEMTIDSSPAVLLVPPRLPNIIKTRLM